MHDAINNVREVDGDLYIDIHTDSEGEPPQPREADEAATTQKVRERILDKKGDRRDNVFSLSQLQKEKVYPNYWTDSSLNLLGDWLSKCEDAAEKHTTAAKLAKNRNRLLMIPTLIIGSAATGLAFFSVGDACSDATSGEPKLFVAVLTSMLSVLHGVGSLCSFSERQSEHIAAAANFTNLSRKIQVCVFLPMELRGQCEVVLTDVSGEFTSLVNTSPLV